MPGQTKLEKARAAFVAEYAADVRENPDAFKDSVLGDPEGVAASLVDGLDLDDVRQFTRDLRAERRAVKRARLSFA